MTSSRNLHPESMRSMRSMYSMRAILHRLAQLSVFFSLAACAGLPRTHLPQNVLFRDSAAAFMLEGRFSLQYEGQSYSGRLSWRHADDADEVLLASPLGQGMAEIFSDTRGARLRTGDGKSYSAENAETLTQEVLGYPLPLTRLADWLRGRSLDGKAAKPDLFGRPLRLQPDGWKIEYQYDSDDPQALPGRIFIEREGGFYLRLRIDEWQPLQAARREDEQP
jgi:outer membrane lipoprotein LolB